MSQKVELHLKFDYFLLFRRLRSYESHLSTIALSSVESSRTISQILFELTDTEDGGNSSS